MFRGDRKLSQSCSILEYSSGKNFIFAMAFRCANERIIINASQIILFFSITYVCAQANIVICIYVRSYDDQIGELGRGKYEKF